MLLSAKLTAIGAHKLIIPVKAINTVFLRIYCYHFENPGFFGFTKPTSCYQLHYATYLNCVCNYCTN